MARYGLFLDLDGTAADSLDAMVQTYTCFLKNQGCAGSQDEFDRLNGPTLLEIVAYLKSKYGLSSSVQSLLEAYDQLILTAYNSVLPRPGLSRLIEVAKLSGYVIAVVTSNSRHVASRWLRRNGFAADAVVGREDALLGKPHPDLYLRALADTDCDAKHSIAVEDSDQGIRAALAAGIQNCFLCGSRIPRLSVQIEMIPDLDALAEMIENGIV